MAEQPTDLDDTARIGDTARIDGTARIDATASASSAADRTVDTSEGLSEETARLPAGVPAPPPAPSTPEPSDDDTRPVGLGRTPDTPDAQPPAGAVVPPPETPDGDTARGRPAWWRRRSVLVPAAAVAVLGAAYAVDLAVSSGEIPRNTVVAGVRIGGLSPAAATSALHDRLQPRVAAARTVVAADVRTQLSPGDAGLALDIRRTIDLAADQPLAPWTRLVSFFADREVGPVLAVERTALDAQLDAIAEQVDRAPVEATVAVDGTTPRVVQPVDGRALDRGGAADALTAALRADRDPGTQIRLPVRVTHPHVSVATAQRVLDETVTPALSGPVDLLAQDGSRHGQIPVSAIAASLTFTPGEDDSLVVGIDPAKLEKALGPRLSVLGTPAEDARFQVTGDTIRVVPSVDGTGIDPVALAKSLMPALERTGQRTVTARLGPVRAAFTTEQAQALGITEKVSSFTTHFAMSPSATNIRVVAEKVDGALVRPGETFSLNDFTGPRGTAQGYVPSMVIEHGQLAMAVGGGISQFATTMFNAVFFAGLEDVHHKTHSFYISRYPAGRDATVFDGLIDLAWKNDSPTGIYVQTRWVPGSITVTFWGTRHYDIESISGPRRNITQPSVQDKVDDGSGSCIPQSGAAGFDITVTRVFRDVETGAELRRQDFRTHYIPEAVIHCRPAPAPASPDPGPAGTAPAPAPGPSGRRPVRRRG